MIGLDTNLLVRLLTHDDKAQAEYAASLIERHSVFIPKSVLLETEWVLRYTYHFKDQIILDAFEKLLGLPQVIAEDPECVAQALEWYRHHLDFADALHLASSRHTEAFATLDKPLIKKAKKLNIAVMTLK